MPPASQASTAALAPPHDPSEFLPRVTLGATLTDLSTGLPRQGQWRERFAVADLDGDGRVEIITAPPRKSAGGPRVFTRQGDAGWTRRQQVFPPGRYDYGTAVAGDFDRDGRTDAAFAMHLLRVAAYFGTSSGGVVEQSSGLPAAQAGARSARMALVWPRPDGDRLLVLSEALGRGSGPGLQAYRWHDEAWHPRTVADGNFAGDRMAYSDSAHCGRWLAVADVRGGPPALLRHAGERWQRTALPAFPRTHTRIADVAFGDFDGDRCADLAVAHVSRSKRGWYGAVDVFLHRNNGERPRISVRLQHGWRPSALAFVPRKGAPARLAVLDQEGALGVYESGTELPLHVAELPAPEWRRGCAGTALAAADLDADGNAEMIAGFSGEPHALDSGRCRNGGALQAWRVR